MDDFTEARVGWTVAVAGSELYVAFRFGRIERALSFDTDRQTGTVLNLGHLDDSRDFSLATWFRRTRGGTAWLVGQRDSVALVVVGSSTITAGVEVDLGASTRRIDATRGASEAVDRARPHAGGAWGRAFSFARRLVPGSRRAFRNRTARERV